MIAGLPVTAPLTDALVVARRHLLRLARTPQLTATSIGSAVLFTLLFRYVFGGAIDVPGLAYVDFLVPALIAQGPVFDGFETAVALAEDARSGLVERMRSLPMAQSAILTGRALSDTVRQLPVLALIVGVAYLIGFRFHASPLSLLAALGVVVAMILSLFWVFATIGFGTRNPETAQAMTTPFFLFLFVSSAYVPVETMPTWLRGFAEHQPFSQYANAIRCLTQGEPAERLLGHTSAYYTGTSLAWSAVLVLVFAPLALRALRRA